MFINGKQIIANNLLLRVLMDYIYLVAIVVTTFACASFFRLKISIVIFFIIAFAFWYICNMFTGNGVTDAVYYHLKNNIHGTSVDDLLPKIIAGSVFIFVVIAVITASVKLRNKIPKRNAIFYNMLFVVFCTINITQSNAIPNILNSVKNLSYSNGFQAAKDYKNIEYKTTKNYNYVFIYAESLERTFRDIDGVNYTPNITELANAYLDFTAIEQIPGMGWTMAGIVNTQCAVPLVLPQGNAAGNMSEFLSGADCIASHLQNHGYVTEFIRGSDKEFAGGDKFFSQHGWQEQHDKNYFINNKIANENQISGWGVHDDVLMNHAYDEFIKLSSNNKNFLLSFLTVNTHPPSGTYLSSCDNKIQQGINNPMLRNVACSDYLISQFINKIITSEYFNNTIIVLTSDHYMMANSASDALDKLKDKRRNNFIIIKKDAKAKKIENPGTLLDVWPTVLDISSATNTDFGFGRSLLKDENSSILKTYAKNKEINDYLGFSSRLWNYPSLNDKMDYHDGNVTIGKQQYKLPLFGVADKNKNIKNIYFEAFAINVKNIINNDGDVVFYINDCSMTSNKKVGVCGYELTPHSTNQYEITNHGITNRKELNVISPLYNTDLLAVSAGPLNVQTGIRNEDYNSTIPRGVTFYQLNKNNSQIIHDVNFDTCSNNTIDVNALNRLLPNNESNLIFTSNDSAVCIPSTVGKSINEVLRSKTAEMLAVRQQVIGVYNKNETKYIVGKPEKPLDAFIGRDNLKLYQLCDIFSDCH